MQITIKTKTNKQGTYCLSPQNLFLWNNSSRSWLWVITCTWPLAANFSLNMPLDTQKAWIYLLDKSFYIFVIESSTVIWTEAIIYKNWIINTNQVKIYSLRLVVFSNEVSILVPSKLDNDFLRPITSQPVTIFNVWRVSCHVQLIKNFEGKFPWIMDTNTVWNTGDFKISTAIILTIPPNNVSVMQQLVWATCCLHFLQQTALI